MDYEEMLLQITDILKAHNRHHLRAPDHKQTIEQIKNVVFPDIRKDKKEAYDAGYAAGMADGRTTND